MDLNFDLFLISFFQLERLLEHEQFCRNLSEPLYQKMKLDSVLLTDEERLSIAEIVNVLRIFAEKTKVVQTQKMCLSEFLRSLVDNASRTKKISN